MSEKDHFYSTLVHTAGTTPSEIDLKAIGAESIYKL
jgi:hypothetical protein